MGGSEVIGAGFPTINELGQVATRETLSFDDLAVVRGEGIELTIIARHGDAVPGGNGVYNLFREEIYPINSSGTVAFAASLAGTSGGSADNVVRVRSDGVEARIIARKGDPAPNGGTIGSFGANVSPALNDHGWLAWENSVAIAPRISVETLFTCDGDSTIEIARIGDPAPGGAGTFSDFGPPCINQRGDLAFQASLAGTSADSGLFLYQASSGTLAARLRRLDGGGFCARSREDSRLESARFDDQIGIWTGTRCREASEGAGGLSGNIRIRFRSGRRGHGGGGGAGLLQDG